MKQAVVLVLVVAFLGPNSTEGAEPPQMTLRRAIASHQRLIDRNPSNAGLYNDLGNLLILDDRPAEAEEAYENSLRMDPELTSARYNLGLLLLQSDRKRRASRAFHQVLRNEPQHAWAHYQLGVVRASRGRRSSAIKSFARALRLDSDLTDPAVNPHIVDNPLASSAVLVAYADLSPAALAPRSYQNAGRVTRLLVPEIESAPAEGETPAEPLKPKRKRPKRKKNQ